MKFLHVRLCICSPPFISFNAREWNYMSFNIVTVMKLPSKSHSISNQFLCGKQRDREEEPFSLLRMGNVHFIVCHSRWEISWNNIEMPSEKKSLFFCSRNVNIEFLSLKYFAHSSCREFSRQFFFCCFESGRTLILGILHRRQVMKNSWIVSAK